MEVALIIFGSLFVIWVLLSLKTSRPDGTLVKGLHPYRRIMSFIMPGRNESVVYYDDYVKADKLLEYIADPQQRFHVDVTHCLVAATALALNENPRMNQFTLGHRLYRRKGVWITFSMKRKKLDKKAKIAAVKLEVPEGQTFEGLCGAINEKIGYERSDAETYADKELHLFNLFPRCVIRFFVKVFKVVDYFNILPKSFIENDGFYTSMFIANLGSLGMGAAYHHLYEWGTCPLFLMVGKVEDRPVVVDGELVVQKTLHLRWTYDERIDDGLTASYGMASARRALEDPYKYLGCIAEDGSDARPLDLTEDTED